jgi:hypothetical protein
LRQRYAPSEHQLFGDVARDRESRGLLRQQVAEDLYQVLRLFADQPTHAGRPSYQAMDRIFHEQCEVQEEKVTVKEKTGNTVMQNPSDPDASYDGHKGPGYQAQLSETCHPDNETQLITCVLPQTAAVPDEEAVAPVLADLEASGLLPEQLLGDMHYPSDENVQLAESYGVELVGPVPGAAPARRREQETEVFRERYRRRSGIESTNSGLKRRTGLGRLRVRGRPRVFQALYLKVTGWNILRASVCTKMREFVRAKAQTAVLRVCAAVCATSWRVRHAAVGLKIVFSVFYHRFSIVQAFLHAA